MRKNNPAVYECPKGKSKLHTWKRVEGSSGKAVCVECDLVLNREDADEVFDEGEIHMPRMPTQKGVCISPSCACMENYGHCIVTGRLPI